jgi:5-(carboxyamino)imidazole ribonucleotide synthase
VTHEAPRHDVAVIGGGQLARMMQQPAIALGLRLSLLAEGPDVSAAQVIGDHHIGTHTDLDDLRRAVQDAPVVTFDHEHVPPEHLRALAQEGHVCRPGPDALIHAQDKLVMRRRLTQLGVPCPRWAEVSEPADVEAFGFPAIVKTARGGYDGKGVWKADSPADLDEPFRADGALLVEELVPFRRELSAQVARSATGEMVDYPVVESCQVDGVCFEVIAPAPNLDPVLEAKARQIARTLAEELDVVGMLAVELFETDDDRVLVNELAMRPHNTGHWSIDGAVTSQFENHLRAVTGLPLGSSTPRQPWTVMVNILGGAVEDLAAQREVALAAQPDVKVHLYGKAVKPGRKVGHVTAVGEELEDVLRRARHSAALLTDGVEP